MIEFIFPEKILVAGNFSGEEENIVMFKVYSNFDPTHIWNPGSGYNTQHPTFQAIAPLLKNFDLNSLQDGATQQLGEWIITRGSDEHGRAIVTQAWPA